MSDSKKLITLMSNHKRYERIVGYLARYYGDREAARDAVSDVMLSLLDGTLDYQYNGTAKPESFVIANARYRLARPIKTVSLDAPVGEGDSVLGDFISGGCNTTEVMERIESSFNIKRVSQQIKDTSLGKRYQVFKLLKFGLSPREIVEFMDISMTDVMNHITSIRKQFKSLYHD